MGLVAADIPDRERLEAAYRRGADVYASQGSPLYAFLARSGADDEEILDLTRHAMEGAPPVHLFTSVHYLLLGGVDDPLARFFPTLTDDPLPPEGAWPDFTRFCREHADELRELMLSRPVQMTYVERCRTLMPAMSHVADLAGEPLNLIEIGCSAGVLLTFDRYAYSLRPGERVGAENADILLTGEIEGGPALRIPKIGRRTGLDLNVIDARRADDRRWMLATCFPELLTEQRNLAKAMAIVADTEIAWYEGDALANLDRALAEMPDPVCVYHSACLFYWPAEAKAALHQRLLEASKGRTIWRLGIEPSERFTTWQAGDSAEADRSPVRQAAGETMLTVYRNGKAQETLLALSGQDFGLLEWQAD